MMYMIFSAVVNVKIASLAGYLNFNVLLSVSIVKENKIRKKKYRREKERNER